METQATQGQPGAQGHTAANVSANNLSSASSISAGSDEYLDTGAGSLVESSQSSLLSDLWRTQQVPAVSCLATYLSSEVARDARHPVEIIRYQLMAPEQQTSPETILAALSWATISRAGSQEAGFGVCVRKATPPLPLRVPGDRNTTVEELVKSAGDALRFAGLHPPSTYLEPLLQLQFVIDLTDVLPDQGSSSPVTPVHDTESSVEEPHFILRVTSENGTTTLEAEYKPSFVTDVCARRLLWQLDETLLQFQAHSPSTVIGAISVVSREDLAQIQEWNSKPLPDNLLYVHAKIEAWALETPTADAVDAWDAHLNFSELHELSSRLSHYLRDVFNVVPGDIIPFCIDRSGLAIACMLGVMKAGAAFVPLHPSSPKERNDGIVETCGSTRVLTAGSKGTFNDIAIPVSWELLRTLPPSSGKPLPEIKDDTLAYVYFTSGSTGRPKGVMIEHRSLSYGLLAHGGEVMAQDSTSRVLQFASLTFDASLSENLAPLSNGSCVCVPDSETRLEGIADFINAKRVNWAFFTPSFFKLINPEDVPNLRMVALGGEAITPDCIERWAHKTRLIHGYGPTENTILSTACVVDPSPEAENRSSIGKGIFCKTWVVDPEDHTRLLPIGYVGELILQGPTVARGYLHEPEKTKDAFVDIPEWGRIGCNVHSRRVYKTGDLVRYTDDGSFIFAGRKDTQVKVRGQRLELAEVEWHIPSDIIRYAAAFVPKVGAYKGSLVVVMTCLDSNANSTTIEGSGLCILQGEEKKQAIAIAEDARALLASKLPVYAVPDIWLPIQRMPLSTSGKVDRKALATWLESLDTRDVSLGGRSGKDIFPEQTTARNEIEHIIQEAWAYSLGIGSDQTPLDSSFQSLGGDSIRAVQVLRRCRAGNVQVNIANILKGDTIEELASKSNHSLVESLVSDDLETTFPLSPTQRLYSRHMPPDSHYFNQTCVIRWNKEFDTASIERAVREIVETHSMLRARMVKAETGQWLQLISRGSDSSLHIRSHSAASLDEVRQIIQVSQGIVNIEQGPTTVADMIHVTDGASFLSLVVSHFSIDIVSWEIILEDLESFLSTGRISGVGSMSFQQWCRQQESDTQGLWASQNLLPCSLPPVDDEYWGVSPALNTYGNTTSTKFAVGPKETRFIIDNCGSRCVAVLDVLLASLFLGFVQSFPDRQPPVIWNEGHGREPWRPGQDISRTVGWFTSPVPIMLQTAEREDFWHVAAGLQHFRSQQLHAGMPFFATRFFQDTTTNNHDTMEVVFNYMGRSQPTGHSDSSFHVLPEFRGESGDDASANMERFSLFEISAEIRDDEILFSFTWPASIRFEDEIRAWAQAALGFLNTIPERSLVSNHIPPSPQSCDLSQMRLDFDSSASVFNNAMTKLQGTGSSIAMIVPASSTQQAMAVAQEQDLPYYRTQLLFAVRSKKGPVVTSEIVSAIRAVVSTHAILRTLLVRRLGEPVVFDQVILHAVTPLVEVVEGQDPEAHEPLQFPDYHWNDEGLRYRFTLFESSKGSEVKVLFESSHALIDHASLQTILDDLSKAYAGISLARDNVAFSNLISHTGLLSKDGSIAFWQDLFKITPKGHIGDTSTPSNSWRDFRRTKLQIDASLSSQLRSLCKDTSFTLALVFRMAWAILLARRLRTSHVAFGYVVSGRDVDLPGIENIVGPCLNIVGCVAQIDGQWTAAEFAEELQTQFLATLPHQHAFLDFATTQQETKGDAPATTMFFDTLVNFRRHVDPRDTTDHTLEFEMLGERDPFDYSIVVEVDHFTSDEIEVALSYWAEGVPDVLLEDLAQEFGQVLAGIPDMMRRKIGEVLGPESSISGSA